MPLMDIFQQTKKQSVNPNIDIKEFKFDNKNRPLSRVEVKMQQNNVMNDIIGFTEQPLDLERTSLVVSYINNLYPFLDYAVVYDADREWLKYEERPTRSYRFTQQDLIKINSISDLNKHLLSACVMGTADHQCFWHVLELNIPEWPQFKQAISLFTSHNQTDGLSLCNLVNRFNALYVSDVDLAQKPDPVQLSPFFPALAIPQNIYDQLTVKMGEKFDLKKIPPITEIKGDHQHKCKPTDLDSYVIDLQPGNFYSKINNIQCSFTANAVAALTFAAYAYIHNDIKSDEKWRAFTIDLRMARDFYASGKVSGLDLNNIHIGQNVAQYYLYYAGTKQSNLLEVATAFQNKCLLMKQTDLEMWTQTFAQLTMTMESVEIRNPSSFFISNLGKVDHGSGPVVQSLNVSPSNMNCEEPPFQLTYVHTGGGKYGCMIAQQRQECISEEKQKAIWAVMNAVHELNKAEGPEKITVEVVMEIMIKEFAKL